MQVGEFAVSIAEISINAATPGRMAGIIGVRQGEAFEDAELRFNQIEPGGFRGRPDGLDAEPPQESQKRGWSWTLCRLSRITKSRFRG